MNMRHFQEPTFEKGEIADITSFTEDFKKRGYTFININATTCEGYCEVLYAFRAPEGARGVTGITVDVPNGTHLPSITGFYPEAFVFENEAHDLFGIPFDGMSIDYGGDFYTLSLSYPMNPKAATAAERNAVPGAAGGEEVAHE